MDTVTHKDYLDRPISVGDAVAYITGGMLKVGVVDKINPAMIRIKPVVKKDGWHYYSARKYTNVYPNCVVIIPKEDVMWFQLKQ